MSQRKRLCPQCKIHRFRVLNDDGDSVVVIVTADYEVVPVHEDVSLEGFNLDVLYCLGCSWKGSPRSLVV
jgi:hypothetical protein